MLRAFAHHVVCCCVLLRLVGSCWMKFETGQTSEPTSANISIVSRSSKRGPTMLRSFAQHIQQCCAGTRALHATYPHKYIEQEINMASEMENVPESFVFSSKDPTCCDLLRCRLTSRNKRQHCWAQQCCVLLRAFARAFKLILLFILLGKKLILFKLKLF